MTNLHLRILAALAVALLIIAPYFLSPFRITLLNYVGMYALVAVGLVLLTGIAGIVSFGQGAFVGVAAYATAWVSAIHGYSPWLGLGLAIVVTCVCAALLGLLTLRLKGHFLSISTIAWGLVIGYLFGNLEGFGRYNGIPNIPPITVGSIPLAESWQIHYLIWAIVLAMLVFYNNLLDSRVGRAIRTLRGGNTLVESLGISSYRTKLVTFVLAAFLAALSGWLYAHLSRFISPTPFEISSGINYLMMAMVGGPGNLLGGVLGSAIITILKNSIQDYLPLLDGASAGQLEIVVFSILFIVFLQHARHGIVPFIQRMLPKSKMELSQPADLLPTREKPALGSPLLKVADAERRFGSLLAVNKVGFEVHAGEILGLIGPNGAGKSTMFNLITGVLKLSGGAITFKNDQISSMTPSRIANAGIARTFQHVKLRPRMTLLENVMLGTYSRTKGTVLQGLLGLNTKEEASARFEALRQLQRVGLDGDPFELAGNLPLGKQRLLEIARALAADPTLLILDEPAAGLRKQEKHQLADLLMALRAEHLTVLLVEHDMDFVMGLVDRIVVMDFGTKLCEGKPAEIRANPRVQEAYLGGVV